MADWTDTPAHELASQLRSKDISPVELTEHYLRRIEALNPQLNAYLTVAGDEAMASAKTAEAELAAGQVKGPLHGVPISVKDLEMTAGIRSTLGSLIYKDHVPSHDSGVVERVKASGAIILGKTNTPEFGMRGTTENLLGDACRNPWNTDRTSGGSSGGAGAAVAAGLCPLATATDAGGSIRIPSSFCGTYGIKPSLGRVPRFGGLGRPSPNLVAQSGPMTTNVRDAAILLQVLAGPDDRDANMIRETPPDFLAALDVRRIRPAHRLEHRSGICRNRSRGCLSHGQRSPPLRRAGRIGGRARHQHGAARDPAEPHHVRQLLRSLRAPAGRAA